ncbi:MAG TPA: energy transducer TonB [Vicinamibacterales bacterium]|nr:energy transducer TonB [Vicinamibacterales bacterium]
MHVAILAVVVLLRPLEHSDSPTRVSTVRPVRLVLIADPRPAARGGGQAAAPKPIQRQRPRTAPPVSQPTPPIEPPTIEPPRETQAIAEPAPSPPSVAQADVAGPPRIGGGDGDRPGAGPGGDGGPGGGGNEPYGVGNGVTAPIPLRRPPPAYTADAMRQRVQGVVVLDCVVQPDATCSDIRVTQSLDTRFGLDQQAIASAREWRFRPGLRAGMPVPVRVTLEIQFTIR